MDKDNGGCIFGAADQEDLLRINYGPGDPILGYPALPDDPGYLIQHQVPDHLNNQISGS